MARMRLVTNPDGSRTLVYVLDETATLSSKNQLRIVTDGADYAIKPSLKKVRHLHAGKHWAHPKPDFKPKEMSPYLHADSPFRPRNLLRRAVLLREGPLNGRIGFGGPPTTVSAHADIRNPFEKPRKRVHKEPEERERISEDEVALDPELPWTGVLPPRTRPSPSFRLFIGFMDSVKSAWVRVADVGIAVVVVLFLFWACDTVRVKS